MTEEHRIVKIEGHPILRFYDDKISIKEADYMKFRDFMYKDIASIKIYRPFEGLYNFFYFGQKWLFDRFRKDDPFVLGVNLKNGTDWKFNIEQSLSQLFVEEISKLNEKIDEVVIKN